jgi:hypothetical protein
MIAGCALASFTLGTRTEEIALPTISMFYGIIIRMYFAPGEHPPPHFHVYYAEYTATVDIRTCEVIEGNLPRKQIKLVLAWSELHQEELMNDWNLFKINAKNSVLRIMIIAKRLSNETRIHLS